MEPMTKEKLRELYFSTTNKELADKLGVSKVTLITTIKRYGIPVKTPKDRVITRKIKIQE